MKKDFNGRCGYCDISEHILGEANVFQIDHFAPKKFEHLINDYKNLVYCCYTCNRAKWNKWPMDKETPSHNGAMGFIDPCDAAYDENLGRDERGDIVAKTELGSYIRRELKLYLMKRRYLWLTDITLEQIEYIREFLRGADRENAQVRELEAVYHQLSDDYFTYFKITRT